MAEKISPEERLFKVIQQGKQAAGQEVKASEKQTGSWYEKLMNLMPARTLGKTSAASGKSFIAAIDWPELVVATSLFVLCFMIVLTIMACFPLFFADSRMARGLPVDAVPT
ncbi:MAG: hypothetical protein WCR20_22530 [Verrucomicrobiota bacterium]